MNYPDAALSTLEAIYRHARDICVEIEEYAPDVVIGLAHSGWMPVAVAQALWAETRAKPFPASLRTNIGLEKNKFYVARYGKDFPAFCCGECCSGPGRRGHYVAWVMQQKAWLKTLQKQIKAVQHKTPGRILVVDDIFGGYRSGLTALALLLELYPQLETYVFAGAHDLTDNFVTGWLEQYVPALVQEITSKYGADARSIRYISPWQEILKPLITGTEDISPDRLDWKFIDRGSECVKAVADYVPAEVALSAPGWARDLACSYALARLKNELPDGDPRAEPEDEDTHLWPISQLSLELDERLAARAWLQCGVTESDVAVLYGGDPKLLKRGLWMVRKSDDWQQIGPKKLPFYYPNNSNHLWVNAYSTFNRDAQSLLVNGIVELLPGQAWAGVSPVALPEADQEKFFGELLGRGVDSLVDLTNAHDLERGSPYLDVLSRVAAEQGRQVEVYSQPLPFREVPSRRQMALKLAAISRLYNNGHCVYIHAGHNLEGRTPLVLACILINRGMPAKQALAQVEETWMQVLPYLITSPLSAAQRQFILEW